MLQPVIQQMIEEAINHYITRHEALLEEVIDQADIPAPRIKKAIHYALFPGGKRLRPLLVYLCGELVNAPEKSLDLIAVAIEITHCYSLIHDDLPAMDNDDIRRGKASCHRAFDEATAILVGDGMQALAIDILLTRLHPVLNDNQIIRVVKALVHASGPSGMVSGQALDLSELTNPELSESDLCKIHQLKTGKLISACIEATLAAGSPTAAQGAALNVFAEHFGLLFQMQDDYLDRYRCDVLGKGRASDLANEKITYASLFSQQDLYSLIQDHYNKTYQALDIFYPDANKIIHLLNNLRDRIKI